MASYRLVYDSRHPQADCQEPGSAPESYARQSSMGYPYIFFNLQDVAMRESVACAVCCHHHHVRLLEVDKHNQHRVIAQYEGLIVG